MDPFFRKIISELRLKCDTFLFKLMNIAVGFVEEYEEPKVGGFDMKVSDPVEA